MNKCEKPRGKAELVVYSCHCVDHGPEQRVFDEDDIRAAGGIVGVETERSATAIGLSGWA